MKYFFAILIAVSGGLIGSVIGSGNSNILSLFAKFKSLFVRDNIGTTPGDGDPYIQIRADIERAVQRLEELDGRITRCEELTKSAVQRNSDAQGELGEIRKIIETVKTGG